MSTENAIFTIIIFIFVIRQLYKKRIIYKKDIMLEKKPKKKYHTRFYYNYRLDEDDLRALKLKKQREQEEERYMREERKRMLREWDDLKRKG